MCEDETNNLLAPGGDLLLLAFDLHPCLGDVTVHICVGIQHGVTERVNQEVKGSILTWRTIVIYTKDMT